MSLLLSLWVCGAACARPEGDSGRKAKWVVYEPGGQFGCKTPAGKVVLPARYPVPPVLAGSPAIVVVGDSFAVVNQAGEHVVPSASTSYQKWGSGYVLFGQYRSAMIAEGEMIQGWALWPMPYLKHKASSYWGFFCGFQAIGRAIKGCAA